jgi:uncharacterized protein (TIGR03083 family)
MGMQLDRQSFEELLGAYALDACEPDEVAALDAYVDAHPEAFAEVERLRAAAAWIGASGSTTPPPGLRGALLTRANAVEPASGLDAYTQIVDVLAGELDEFPAGAVEEVTANGLTVRELVGHLAAGDGAFLEALTVDTPTYTSFSGPVVEELTRAALASFGDASFDDMRAAWDTTSRALRAAAVEHGDVKPMGYELDDAMVIRTFETWTHLDDIRRVAGKPGYVPSAPVLRAMSGLAKRLLPFTMALTGRARPGETVQIVLTGPGGRAWDVPLAPGEEPGEPAATMTVDIVDWCRRVADRLPAESLDVRAGGDVSLVEAAVLAAPALAVL